MLISEVGQAAWIICLEEMFCTEPGKGKAVAGLGSGLAHGRGGVPAMAAWGLGSTGALWCCQSWVVFQLWTWRRKVTQSGNYSAQHSQWEWRLFQNTLQSGRVFWLFSVDIPSSALPSDSLTWEPAGSFGGTWWARGAAWPVGAAHGCHWSPMAVTSTPKSLPQYPLLGKREVLLHVRSVAGPEGLCELCLFAFAASCCLCM